MKTFLPSIFIKKILSPFWGESTNHAVPPRLSLTLISELLITGFPVPLVHPDGNAGCFRVLLAGGFHWSSAKGDFQSLVTSPWWQSYQLLVLVNAFVDYVAKLYH